MGCDIHATLEYDQYYQKKVEKDTNAKHSWWAFAKDIDIDRNYALFTILAGVRDCGVRPVIAAPRGLPEDSSSEFAQEYEAWYGDAHSTSYVTWPELRDWMPDADSIKDFEWDVTNFRQDDWYKVMELLADKYGEENVRLCFFFDN